jgi:hypothetical protein
MKMMRMCLMGLLVSLAAALLLGPLVGCVNVKAPEKIEVKNGDGKHWRRVGEDYRRQYGGSGDKDRDVDDDKYDD